MVGRMVGRLGGWSIVWLIFDDDSMVVLFDHGSGLLLCLVQCVHCLVDLVSFD